MGYPMKCHRLWFAWLLASLMFAPAAAFAQDDADAGFRPIFNGRDLSGWDGNPKFWSVSDGAITGRTTTDNPAQSNTFLIWRDGTLDDFELHLSFRIVANNNQG